MFLAAWGMTGKEKKTNGKTASNAHRTTFCDHNIDITSKITSPFEHEGRTTVNFLFLFFVLRLRSCHRLVADSFLNKVPGMKRALPQVDLPAIVPCFFIRFEMRRDRQFREFTDLLRLPGQYPK
jgi:hypothetical protein